MANRRYREYEASQETTNEKQDAAFDQFLEEMKAYVLRLPHKSERQRIALWIKKLCEPVGGQASARKNRNLYAQLLLHMLKRGLLEEPFSRRPQAGPLPTMPAYMSIYLDDPVQRRSPGSKDEELGREPDWVRGELASNSGSVYSEGSRVFSTSKSDHEPITKRDLLINGNDDEVNGHESHRRTKVSTTNYSSDDSSNIDENEIYGRGRYESSNPMPSRNIEIQESSDLGYKDYKQSELNVYPSASQSPQTGHANGLSQYSRASSSLATYRDEQGLLKLQDKELDLKVKMAEAKFHEEKLKLQQQHDVAVQKILDRKNMEMEEVKAHYRNKMSELETSNKKLERKISQLQRDLSMIKEARDKQITELKSLSDQTGQSAQNQYEKMLNDKIAEFEQEKFEMQKQHTRNIQELLDDTNERLHKMETEYNQQAATTAVLIQELESRIQQLTQDSENLQNTKTKLGLEKIDLEKQVNNLTSELKEEQALVTKAQIEQTETRNKNEQSVEQMRRKTETSLELIKQEHAHQITKAQETISEQEAKLSEIKHALEDAEYQRQKQLRELESAHQQDRMHQEHLNDKKIRGLQSEMQQQESEYQRRLVKLEATIRERDEQNERLMDMNKQQASQAEHALEDFKMQVEKNSGKMFDEMKTQMEKVEADLFKSKSIREKQAKEFIKQVEEMKTQHEKQTAEFRISHEQEKAELLRQHQAEKEILMKDHDDTKELHAETFHKKIRDLETLNRNRAETDSKTISELEQQVRSLREEVIQANSLRKTQLVELGLLREEEKQNFKRQEEQQVSRFRSQQEQQRLQLQREHSEAMEKMIENTNTRLKDMERDYNQRSTRHQTNTESLQSEIQKMKDEIERMRSNHERKTNENAQRHEDEKSNIKKQNTNIVKSLEHDVETQKTMIRHLEKRCQKLELESQEKVSRLRLQYEEKMKGLLPITLRGELEDTIRSLKEQITMLQSRTQILQEELEVKEKLSSTLNVSKIFSLDEGLS